MKERVVTSVVLATIALLAVFARPTWVADGIVLLLAVLAAAELARIVPLAGASERVMALLYGVVVIFTLAVQSKGQVLAPIVGACGGAVFILLSFRWERYVPLGALGAAIYVANGLAAIRNLASHHAPGPGFFDPAPILLMVLFPVWAADVFGYFGGRRFGKRLLAPTISPKKTVEGFVAGLVGAFLIGLLFAFLLHQPLWKGAAVGLAAGILGPMGDLLESALKRRAGVKDSGTLLPGHGGVLDRIDSLLLAAPAAALILLS